ncbi:DcuS/MalK family sensor histidine kinase [Niallia endozanthoxylica]|uniref:histidine kinase n=1 Tax=Niallia endozanthoxylica TaxID=2036016 RepID=A0A5J5GY64_9BACI|nr:DcuS/MalK family sensor histidine kinase [Niallia endozanthoxylica]KAA9012523.1 two-component system sensor histidine kinase DcuS [Niallia endozanthoxylica]
MHRGKLSLQNSIIFFVLAVVFISLLITEILISQLVADTVENSQSEKATNVARMVALSPLVMEGLSGERDESDIQTFANDIKAATNVEFVVVMDMDGIRKSHPDSSKVGKHFRGGDEGPVLQGKEHVSISKGTLGHSLRSFTPVIDNGKQVGAVAVGITLKDVEKAVDKSRKGILIGIGLGLLIGVIGAVVLARYIKKILLGLEPIQIARLVEERSAMLNSVREGIIATDQDSRITLVNKSALSIFKKAGLDDQPIGKDVNIYMSTSRMTDVIRTGEAELDQEQEINGVILLVNRVPIVLNKKTVGAISTFRDKTEVRQLAGQLTGVQLYADALRAQAHEFMNKLHVILGMVHMKNYDQLSQYISETVNHRSNEINLVSQMMQEPVLAGFLIGKLSYAREAGVELHFSSERPIPKPQNYEMVHELITIVGNLIDNAIDAVMDCPIKKVEAIFEYADDILTIEVSDTGTGMTEEEQNKVLQKGYSTKGQNRGFGLHLVIQSINKLEGEFIISSKPGQGTEFVVYIPYNS